MLEEWLLVAAMPRHEYYVFASGTNFKSGYYPTRKAAECAMHNYCNRNGINLECVECDAHERKYSNHNGVRFYINRV